MAITFELYNKALSWKSKQDWYAGEEVTVMQSDSYEFTLTCDGRFVRLTGWVKGNRWPGSLTLFHLHPAKGWRLHDYTNLQARYVRWARREKEPTPVVDF